jgi:hypothetical protein
MIQKIMVNNRMHLSPPVQQEEGVKKLFTILNPEFVQIIKFKRLDKKDWPKGGQYLSHQKVKGRWKTVSIQQNIYYYSFDPGGGLNLPRSAFFALKELYKKHSQNNQHNSEHKKRISCHILMYKDFHQYCCAT